jgi:hypothetical protein
MLRDSLIEQIISFSPIPVVVAAVSGLECPVRGLECPVRGLECPVRGLEMVVICLCEL